MFRATTIEHNHYTTVIIIIVITIITVYYYYYCYHLNMRNERPWIEQRNFYNWKFLLTHDIVKD